jgi:hypothetical protein
MDAMMFAVGADVCGSVIETDFCRSDALLMAGLRGLRAGKGWLAAAKL